MPASVSWFRRPAGPQGQERLFRKGRISIGFLRRCREILEVPVQLRLKGVSCNQYRPGFRMCGTHKVRLYALIDCGCGCACASGGVRILKQSVQSDIVDIRPARRAGHEGDPPLGWPRYVRPVCPPLKQERKKPRTPGVRGFLHLACFRKPGAGGSLDQASLSSSSGNRTSVRR